MSTERLIGFSIFFLTFFLYIRYTFIREDCTLFFCFGCCTVCLLQNLSFFPFLFLECSVGLTERFVVLRFFNTFF